MLHYLFYGLSYQKLQTCSSPRVDGSLEICCRHPWQVCRYNWGWSSFYLNPIWLQIMGSNFQKAIFLLFFLLHHTLRLSTIYFLFGSLYTLKVACRVKTNTAWTTKNTTSSNYFSKKFKTNTLKGHKRYIKISELEINNLRIQILAAKMTQFYLKILPFASPKSLQN